MLNTYKLSLESCDCNQSLLKNKVCKSSKTNGKSSVLCTKALIPDSQKAEIIILMSAHADLKFVKKFTRPNFRAKEFYTLKTRKLRLFLPAIHSKNASK